MMVATNPIHNNTQGKNNNNNKYIKKPTATF